MEDEDEETLLRILSELDDLHQGPQTSAPRPISESALSDLHRLLQSDDSEVMDRFYLQLGSKNHHLSSLTHHIASAMDPSTGQGSTRVSLLAADVYLSLILSPGAPVLALFTPLAFLSLLHAVRRALKQRPAGLPDDPAVRSALPARGRKKRGIGGSRREKNSRQSYGSESGEAEFDNRVLFAVLKRLVLVMGLIHLDRFPECFKSLVQTVAEIPAMALDLWGDSSLYEEVTRPSLRILGEVLKPEHGDPANSAAEIAKALSTLIFSGKSQMRSFALGFLKNTMMSAAKESDGVRKAAVNLPKFLVQKAPEKAEPRALAVESIMEIVTSLQHSDQIGFAEYLVKMTQGKSKLRLLAVDLVLTLLVSLKDWGEYEASENDDLWGMRCLQALIQRCSDSMGQIRARALSNLAQLVGHFAGNENKCTILKEAMGIGNGRKQTIKEGRIIGLLRERCTDEKAAVRKAALTLITKLTAILGGSFDEGILKTLGIACSDPLVSIRKAAISALSEAFRKFPNGSVAVEWMQNVPCLITDNESNIQEECETLFLELVLDRISAAGSSGSAPKLPASHNSAVKGKSFERQIEALFPEGTLSLLREVCHGDVTPWVKKICTNLGKKKLLRPKVSMALQNIIKSSESLWLSHSMPIEKWTAPEGAWFLLSEVSVFLPKSVEWEFLHHHWEILDNNGDGGVIKSSLVHGHQSEEQDGLESNSVTWAGDRVYLLQTISNVALELPHEPAAELAHNLLQRIEGFSMHSTEVNAHVKALRTLCRQKALSSDEADELVLRWACVVLSKACHILEKYVSEESQADKEGTFSTPPPPMSRSRKGKTSTAMSQFLRKAVTAVYTIGSVIIVCPSADTSSIVPLLHTIITSENTDPKLSKLRKSTISIKQIAPSLYIQAWLTMGKICLADVKVAKRYIPLFVKELENSDYAALRNNLVVAMADFCVRYTALVDGYITKITKCLCDPCELVRRQTFILLSRLLQRDYVKWRGVLFLRFLLSLVDDSAKIRQLADFLFGSILKVKAPLLAYNSFVEAIYVLNDCHAHSGHSSVQGSRAESRMFSLWGNDETKRSKRMHIYTSLLKQMAPEHLLATFAKICAEILAAASDGMLNIEDSTGQSVLQDAFKILVCKEIRIPTTRGSTTDTTDIDDEGGESSKGRAISQAVRKGLIQTTIPIFIELKRLLETKHSPLTGSLMDCLRLLLKDYKNEIDEMLVADKQLQKELVYDMQKHDAVLMARDDETTAQAQAQATATARSVLREVNRGPFSPPLGSLSVPKVRPLPRGSEVAATGGGGGGGGRSCRPKEVLESLRRKQPFIAEDE